MENNRPYIRNRGYGTAVLMVHGFMGTPRYFDDILPLVPSDWDIYAILLKGHGKTVDDFAEASMSAWKAQVDGMLDTLCRRYEKVVVLGHSMGTLLALDASLKYSHKLSALVLFASPLRIFLKPISAINALRVIFKCTNNNDPLQVAARNAYSIAPDLRLWKYLKWIPRCLELFSLARHVRCRVIQRVTTPCFTFQSRKDEMVSMRSMKYLGKNPGFENITLETSRHFLFSPEDFEVVKTRLTEIFKAVSDSAV